MAKQKVKLVISRSKDSKLLTGLVSANGKDIRARGHDIEEVLEDAEPELEAAFGKDVEVEVVGG